MLSRTRNRGLYSRWKRDKPRAEQMTSSLIVLGLLSADSLILGLSSMALPWCQCRYYSHRSHQTDHTFPLKLRIRRLPLLPSSLFWRLARVPRFPAIPEWELSVRRRAARNKAFLHSSGQMPMNEDIRIFKCFPEHFQSLPCTRSRLSDFPCSLSLRKFS